MRELSFPHREFSDDESGPDVLHAIRQALKDLKYGSLEIIIQDAKVVQIERKEKIRFNNDPINKKR